MSDELDTDGDDFGDTDIGGETEGGKSAKKIALFVIVPLLVFCGIGVGLYASGALDSILSKKETEETKPGHDKKEPEEPINFDAVFLPIPDIVVNLKANDNKTRFLRLRVQIEVENELQRDALEQVMPRVVDQFQTYLREMRVQDLEGSAGIYRLQKELITRVNAAAYPLEVKDVLFQEMLIQ